MSPIADVVTDLVWANAEETAFSCVVKFNHLQEPVPFGVSAAAKERYALDIWDGAMRGDYGPIAPYAPPPVTPPASVTPAQAKIILFENGLLDEVEALVAGHPYRPVSIWWSNAIQFDRGNAYLIALGIELGLTDEQMDEMFIAAAKK